MAKFIKLATVEPAEKEPEGYKMNELKFRIWDVIRNEWLEEHIVDGFILYDIKKPSKELIVNQYWKPDKDDKDMYSGDIISVHQFLFDGEEVEEESKAIVRTDEDGFTLEFFSGDFIRNYTCEDRHITPVSFVYGLHEESFSLLGNIQENKELLR